MSDSPVVEKGRLDHLAMGVIEKVARAAEANLGTRFFDQARPMIQQVVEEWVPTRPYDFNDFVVGLLGRRKK